MDYNTPWRHVRHGKAQRHYEQVAEQAKLTRVANDEADRVAAEERLREHGITVQPVKDPHDVAELASRRVTAAQLREIADLLDPPTAADELRTVAFHVRQGDKVIAWGNWRLKQDETFAHDVYVGDERITLILGWS